MQLSLPIQQNFTTSSTQIYKFILYKYSLTCLVLCKLLMQATPPCGQQANSDVHQEWAWIPSLDTGHSAFATASLSHLDEKGSKQVGIFNYIQRIMPTKYSKSEASGFSTAFQQTYSVLVSNDAANILCKSSPARLRVK